MWTIELLSSGLFKLGGLAVKGVGKAAARGGRKFISRYGAGEGIEAGVNAVGNAGEVLARNTVAAGKEAYKAIMNDYVGPAADRVVNAVGHVMVKDPASPIGARMHPLVGEALFFGTALAAVPGGIRQSRMGLINYGEGMQSITGAAMSPTTAQGVGVSKIDDLGATGELALALHRLRRG